MTERFHRGRWSETRKQIDAMSKGDVLEFSACQYFNAHASVQRLNDAYDGERSWSMTVKDKAATITRTK